jgi:cation transport ATPase
MNVQDVAKSCYLGLGIGVVVVMANPGAGDVGLRALTVLASGAIGLVVGLVTEWLTARLPLHLARPRTYFLLNGLIALATTAAIMGGLVALAGATGHGADGGAQGWGPVVALVLAIVVVANVVDYLLFRRTRSRLRTLQASLDERGADGG